VGNDALVASVRDTSAVAGLEAIGVGVVGIVSAAVVEAVVVVEESCC